MSLPRDEEHVAQESSDEEDSQSLRFQIDTERARRIPSREDDQTPATATRVLGISGAVASCKVSELGYLVGRRLGRGWVERIRAPP